LTWERLGNISAIGDLLQSVKKEVTNALGCSYQNSTRDPTDTAKSSWRIAGAMRDTGLNGGMYDQDGNHMAKKTAFILLVSEKHMKLSTVTTFNKKIKHLHEGYVDELHELDIDDVPAVRIAHEVPESVIATWIN